jgi:hypothetical protein
MKIPNASQAIIAPEKIRDYLLNPDHQRGGSKSRVLLSLGYRRDNWELLERAIRLQHLTAEVTVERENPWGRRYEIRAPLITPSGRTIIIESIWQIDAGSDVPRFITMYPR